MEAAVKKAKSADWQDGLDERLLQRLLSRGTRPGLVNLPQGETIIARHRNMAAAMPLPDRLSRSWFEIGEGKPAPIVYVQPKAFVSQSNDAAIASAPKGELVHSVQSVSQVQPQKASSPAGGGLGEGDQNMDLFSRQAVSPLTGVDSRTLVLQRKPVEGASPMPLVAPKSNGVSSSKPVHSSGSDSPAQESIVGDGTRGKLAIVTASPITRSLRAESNRALPLANRTDSDGISMETNSTRDAVIPVVTPIWRQHPPQFILAPEHPEKPADDRARPDDPTGARHPRSHANATLPRVFPSPPMRTQAGAVSLPIVRESSATEMRRAAVHGHATLPLAGKARASHGMAEQSAGARPGQSLSARATATETGWPTPPTNRSLAADNTPPAENGQQPAPNIDIDRIVDKVERRFARRFAIEAERRGKMRWL